MAVKFEKHLTKRSASDNDPSYSNFSLYRHDYPSPDTDVLVNSYQNQVGVDTSSYVGWNIPHFHSRRKMGELMPFTPWRQVRINGSVSKGEYEVTSAADYPNDWSKWWTTGGIRAPYSDWVITEADLQSCVPEAYLTYVQAAAAKMYGKGHDTLTFIMELASCKRMFMDTGKRLLAILAGRKVPVNVNALSSDWLSARYGWRTLIMDLQDLSDALQKLGEEQKTRMYSRKEGENSWTYDNAWSVEKAHYYVDCVLHDEVRVYQRGTVAADVSLPTFQFDPLQTGWELIPFSFVLDWFIGVGRALAAISFLVLQSEYAACAGIRVEIDRSFSYGIGETKSTFVSGYDNGEASCTASLELRIPCKVPYTPRFLLKLNEMKILDLIALILQRLH